MAFGVMCIVPGQHCQRRQGAPGRAAGTLFSGCWWVTRWQKGLWKSQKFIPAPGSSTASPKLPKFAHLGPVAESSPRHTSWAEHSSDGTRAQTLALPWSHVSGLFSSTAKGRGKQMSLGNTGKEQKHMSTYPSQQSIHSSIVKGETEKTMKLRGETPVKLNN